MQKYKDNFQDEYGNAVSGALVYIYEEGTTTKVPVYADDETTQLNDLADYILTDADGQFEFKAADGVYDILIEKTGYQSDSFNSIQFLDGAAVKSSIAAIQGTGYDYIQVSTPSAAGAGEWWLKQDTGGVYLSSGAGTGNWDLQYTQVIIYSTNYTLNSGDRNCGGYESIADKTVLETANFAGLYLDGSNDYVSIPDDDDLDFATFDFSILGYFKTDKDYTGGIGQIVSKRSGTGSGFQAYINTSNELEIAIDEGSEITVASDNAVNDGSAHIFLCLGDRSGNLTLYIDGLLQTDSAAMAGTTISNSEDLYFGSDAAASEFFRGEIYAIKLFNRLLSASESKTLSSNPNALISYANESASNTDLTSGTLTVGKRYRINTYVSSDDFTNVGAASNATGVEFIATGTTPTTWTNSSVLNAIGCIAEYKGFNIISPSWHELQNDNTGTISGATAINSNYLTDTLSTGIVIADFDVKNLLINSPTITTATAKFDRILLPNSSGNYRTLSNKTETWNITAHLMSGTSEKASHLYWLWLDSDEGKLMVPDLVGTADSDVLNSLSVSGATFVTDKVQVDDIVYNMTDFTVGYVKAISSETVITIKDADGNDLDLFPDGDEEYKIHILTPTGLGEYRANIGYAYNNSGSDLANDNGYSRPELQEFPIYEGDASAKDYQVSGTAGFSLVRSIAYVIQKNLFGKTPVWLFNANVDYDCTGTTNPDITFSGVVFKTGSNTPAYLFAGAAAYFRARTDQGLGSLDVRLGASAGEVNLHITDAELDSKPPWATRS